MLLKNNWEYVNRQLGDSKIFMAHTCMYVYYINGII